MVIFREGSKGAVVKQIQKVVGCYPDGIWGRLTTESVKAWQRDHSLTPDGIAGPATLTAMGITAVTGSKPNTEWVYTAYAGQSITLKRSKRRIDYIAVHCTATPEGQNRTVAQIRAQHTAPKIKGGNGWSDIGYHYVVYLDGTVNIGRDVDIAGAHVEGYNSNSIGISYVGGLENDPHKAYKDLRAKDTRTNAQKASLLALLMELRKLYPNAKIQGHRDFPKVKKDCPSFDAKTEYRKV